MLRNTVVLLLLMLLPLAQSGQVYRLMLLVSAVQSSNYTLSVASESQCFAACVGDIKAVSYSAHYNVCRISTCARVQLATSALWSTFVCFSVSPTCSSVPRAMLDWMMTDACGFANTGWLSTGLTMRPFHYGSSTPWSPSYMPSVNVSYFGRAILYPKLQEYMMMTDYSKIPMAYTDSVTLFAYFWLYDSTARFPLIEFAYADAYGNYQGFGPEFWLLGGGIYYNFGSMCLYACYGTIYNYAPPANQWISMAFVIDISVSNATAYINGNVVWSKSNVTFKNTNTMNFIITGGRPGNGLMNGTTYCLRIYRAALTAVQLRDVANSCIFPTLRTQLGTVCLYSIKNHILCLPSHNDQWSTDLF